MDLHEYVKAVLVTESCDWSAIQPRLIQQGRTLHAVAGIVTEAGELQDALKKHLFYGRPLDRTNLIEELGDLMWYVALLCDEIAQGQVITGADVLADVLTRNIAKLKARYAGKFTETRAENRDLDVERKILEW
jgi:NTP pyrophosphatase (non-canonical NTP hydrolase)